jgi:RHS repeat-associated protein
MPGVRREPQAHVAPVAYSISSDEGVTWSEPTNLGKTKDPKTDSVIRQLIGDGTNTYAYDPAGNRAMPGYVVGKGNQLLSDGTYSYTYDQQGNEVTKTNIATGDKWTYGYAVNKELVSAVETASDGTLEKAVEYKYDALGNRVEVDVTKNGATTVQRYAYDGWNPAKATPVGLENFDVWADLDGSSSLTTRYVRGDKVDQAFARVDNSNAFWYLTDRLGSVRDVLDNGGNVKDKIAYDAFGNITSETSATDRGRYAWTGRELDAETDLQYNRARYYDSKTGRWMSQDPLGFDAGDSNLFRYVQNQPTDGTDPSGNQDGDRPIAIQLIRPGVCVKCHPQTTPESFKSDISLADFFKKPDGKKAAPMDAALADFLKKPAQPAAPSNSKEVTVQHQESRHGQDRPRR